MNSYEVTVAKIGSIIVTADSEEETIQIAEKSDESEIWWDGMNATDANILDKNQ